MKVLHVAVFTPTSTNVWQADGFEQLGHDVHRFDYRKEAKTLGYFGRDKKLAKICKDLNPDITLFAKCNDMHINVVKSCNLHSKKTVLWMPDNWLLMDEEFIKKVTHCDIAIFAGRKELEIAKKINSNSFLLHGGYDTKIHYPINIEKKYDVSFIGNWWPDRQKYFDQNTFKIITGAYGINHSKAVSQTKINLNFFSHDGGFPSNRLNKILAAGGFLLTHPWENMEKEFTPGVHLDTFTDPSELKLKIKFYLKNEHLREKIAEQGHQKNKKYDNINYAKTIIKKCFPQKGA